MFLIPSSICLFLAMLLLRTLEYGMSVPLEDYNKDMRQRGEREVHEHEYNDMRYVMVPNIIRMFVASAVMFAFTHYLWKIGV